MALKLAVGRVPNHPPWIEYMREMQRLTERKKDDR